MSDPSAHAFYASPFSLVADPSSAACWAGRLETLDQVRRLCRAWINRTDSTLDVVWSNLGAGKTHLLFHLRHLLNSEFRTEPPTEVWFAEIPEHCGRFTEIYGRLMSTEAVHGISQLVTSTNPPSVSPALVRASRALTYGDDGQQRVAFDWIIGGRPGLRELRAATGIDSRIETDVDAERTLCDMLSVHAASKKRTVILLDEFQRVGHLSPRVREAFLSHFRTLFSRQASHLSIVIAVGSQIEKTALDLLPRELKTIIGMRKPISLPEMNAEEASEFLLRRMRWYRASNFSGPPECPFTETQIRYVIDYLVSEAKARLIPRTILQVFGIVYDELATSNGLELNEASLRSILDGLRWSDVDDDPI